MSETFDVDFLRYPNGFIVASGYPMLDKILERLTRCEHVRHTYFRESASGNGFHIRIECGVEGCEVCRLAFDNSYRYMLDCLFRRPHQRNVLWRRKTYQKADSTLTCDAGDWIEYEPGTAHPRRDFSPLGKSKITGAQGGVYTVDDRHGGSLPGPGGRETRSGEGGARSPRRARNPPLNQAPPA